MLDIIHTTKEYIALAIQIPIAMSPMFGVMKVNIIAISAGAISMPPEQTTKNENDFCQGVGCITAMLLL